MKSYEISDLELAWRRGDDEMPPELERVINAAKEEKLLRSLNLSADAENTIRYNASKSNLTISEYISSLVMLAVQSA